MPDAPRPLGRRAVVSGLAWSAPAVAAVAAAPAFAASPLPVLGGTPRVTSRVVNNGQCQYAMTVDAPLQITGATPEQRFTAPTVTVWVTGTSPVDWTTQAGHSACWRGPVAGSAVTRADGLVYTPYTWTSTCVPSTTTAGTIALPAFRVASGTVTETKDRGVCYPFRSVLAASLAVDPDGTGPKPSSPLTLERPLIV